jgi:hypothetical protein
VTEHQTTADYRGHTAVAQVPQSQHLDSLS